MLKNYLLIAIRNISKSLGHVTINVIGLGIGIALCVIAFLLNAYNSEFNNCYDKNIKDNIYRVEYSRLENGDRKYYGSVNVKHTYFLEKEIPGIESVLRFFGRVAYVKYGENRIDEYLNFCNEPFIKTFPYELIEGSYKYFNEPDAIYLSEELAVKYFGDKPALGQSLEVLVKDTEGGIQNFKVRGIFRQPKPNSSFNYVDMLTNFRNLYRIYNVSAKDQTIEIAPETYIKVKSHKVLSNPVILSKLKDNMIVSDADPDAEIEFRLSPFNKIHKNTGNRVRLTFTNNEINRGTLLTFNLLGIMILLIACFNYTIYAFSFAGKRLKEIGVRKVSGSSPKQIMFQFMSESLLLSIISLFVGYVLLQTIKPFFVDIWGNLPYTFSQTNPVRVLIFLIGITLLMAFVSGFYPAFYVSRFNPSAILAKNARLKKTSWITYSLVLLQQAVTIIGLGASIIFTDNIYWQENMDFGYDKDNLLTIQGLNEMEKSDLFVELVKQHPKVLSVGISWKMLGNGTGDRKVTYEGKDYYVDLMETGPNYMETNKVRLKKGRFWHTESENDMKSTALVNEKFIDITGDKDPIGKQLTLLNGKKVTIIGIIGNYKQVATFQKSEPTVIHYPLEGNFKFLAIRGRSMEDLKEIDEYCKEKWEMLEPFMPYTSMFESGAIEGGRETSISFKKTFLFAAIVALLLSVGGIFSLVTMLIQNRTKEIAIRKTVGSGTSRILVLISRPYIVVSLIAGIIGSSGGFYLVSNLLDNIYDYHVKVKPTWYLLSLLIMLLVTLVTISTQTIKAATANPVEGLRYE